jgi:RNA polymerase sigma factor (sigma-70 family)
MDDDGDLLRRYAQTGDEPAFQELVRRHLPLVFSTALRKLAGDVPLAEDVTQTVFAELARVARRRYRIEQVPGWLHRATSFAAANAVRTEQRRRVREAAAALEQQAQGMNVTDDQCRAQWEAVCVQLHEALDDLGDKDRTAILLRFFERLNLDAVGKALGVSDDAAQKRVERALEKLRLQLDQRGAALSVAALAMLLTEHAITTPPAGLALSVSAHALAPAADVVGAGMGAGWSHSGSLLTVTRVATGAGVLLAAALVMASWHREMERRSAAHSAQAGLVAWWAAEGDARDSAGASHGSALGGVTFVPGMVGQAFHFNGEDGSVVAIPDAVSLRLDREITLMCWFRPDRDSRMGSLVAKRTDSRAEGRAGNPVNYGFYIPPIGAGLVQQGICQLYNDPAVRGGYHLNLNNLTALDEELAAVLSPVPNSPKVGRKGNLYEMAAFFPGPTCDLGLLAEQWHHLAGTYRQAGSNHVAMMTYFDGELRNEITLPGELANTLTNAPVWIGGYPTASFKGCIDEIRLYGRVLSAGEIGTLYRADKEQAARR